MTAQADCCRHYANAIWNNSLHQARHPGSIPGLPACLRSCWSILETALALALRQNYSPCQPSYLDASLRQGFREFQNSRVKQPEETPAPDLQCSDLLAQ